MSRNLRAESEAETSEECCSLAFFLLPTQAPFLYSPDLPAQRSTPHSGLRSPTAISNQGPSDGSTSSVEVLCFQVEQSDEGTSSTETLCFQEGQSDGGTSSIEVSVSRCVKLTTKATVTTIQRKVWGKSKRVIYISAFYLYLLIKY